MNDTTGAARRFHDRTTHTPASVHSGSHSLDWDIKPFPFKVYSDLPPIALPREWPGIVTGAPWSASIEGGLTQARPGSAPPVLTLSGLAELLYYTAGVTKKKSYPGGGEMFFRAAASTGALYQTEVYAVVG